MTQARTGPSDEQLDEARSRAARLTHRRRRMRIAMIAATVVLVAGGAAMAYAASNSDPAKAGATPSSTTPASLGVQQVTVPTVAGTKVVTVRKLDHDHPLRVWIGGDSLAGSFGPALGDLLGATGVVQTQIDYKVSSGLWSNDIRNWQQRATDQMNAANPEVAMYIIGANDTSVVNKQDANGDGVADWAVDYGAKVGRMMDTFVGPQHRMVFWLATPTLGTYVMNRAAVEIDKVVKAEAEKRSHDVIYVDTYRLFADPNGDYARQIVDDQGETITARISDGVHFSSQGAAYLARELFGLLDARWHLTSQADTAHPIAYTIADGSGELVPGYNSAPRSRYRNSSSNGNGSHTSRTYSSNNHSTPTSSSSSSSETTVGGTSPPPATTPPTSPHSTEPHVTPPTT